MSDSVYHLFDTKISEFRFALKQVTAEFDAYKQLFLRHYKFTKVDCVFSLLGQTRVLRLKLRSTERDAVQFALQHQLATSTVRPGVGGSRIVLSLSKEQESNLLNL
jgi:hypothetical protein